jgi:hypothetical protein
MKNQCSCSVCDAHHSVDSGKESINDSAQGGKRKDMGLDRALGVRKAERTPADFAKEKITGRNFFQ